MWEKFHTSITSRVSACESVAVVKCHVRPVQHCAAGHNCRYNWVQLWSTRRMPARWSECQGEPQSTKKRGRVVKNPVQCCIVSQWYLWLMENHYPINHETSTGALVVLNYKRCAKNRGIDGAFENEQQYVTHTLLWDSILNHLNKRFGLDGF